MFINEFAKKYETSTRNIDYWTTIGLLHPNYNDVNGYRDYDEKAEEEIKILLVASAMNCAPLRDTVDMIKHIPKSCWENIVIKQIEKEIEKVAKSQTMALHYAKELQDHLNKEDAKHE